MYQLNSSVDYYCHTLQPQEYKHYSMIIHNPYNLLIDFLYHHYMWDDMHYTPWMKYLILHQYHYITTSMGWIQLRLLEYPRHMLELEYYKLQIQDRKHHWQNMLMYYMLLLTIG